MGRKVVILNGSPRRAGNTAALAAEFTRGAQEAGNTVVHETGDHYLYICDVEQVYGNEAEEAVFAWNGYSQVRPAK